MSDGLDALEQIYFSFQLKLNDALTACATQAERDQIMTQYVAARTNYFACVNKAFHDDDPAVQALVAQAKDAVGVIQTIDDRLGDIAGVINDLTKAVGIGAQIAAKVIAV